MKPKLEFLMTVTFGDGETLNARTDTESQARTLLNCLVEGAEMTARKKPRSAITRMTLHEVRGVTLGPLLLEVG